MAYFEFPHTRTYDHDLGWLIKHIKDLTDAVNNGIITDEELQKQIDEINQWIASFDTEFVEKIVRQYLATMIFVSISDSGYIIYHIPKEWKNITFNTTGLDIALKLQPEYGHLVLSY